MEGSKLDGQWKDSKLANLCNVPNLLSLECSMFWAYKLLLFLVNSSFCSIDPCGQLYLTMWAGELKGCDIWF
jgi:hypothetical protein